MSFSEDRIYAVAGKIAHALMRKRYVLAKAGGLRQLTTYVEKPLLHALSKEHQLNDEVRAMLRSMSTCPPEGSFQYNALFQKKKEELATRRGIDLS